MYATQNEIIELVRSFENCTLDRSSWTHAAHLTVALWYLIHHPGTAIDQIRSGIQRYNQAHGVESTPISGYHETITLFWIHLIQSNLSPVNCLLEQTDQVVDRYSNPALLFEYYSRSLIFSLEARSRWIEPNLKSF